MTRDYLAAVELKRDSLSAAGEFTGYASVFGGAPDTYGDVIARGAFAESLASHRVAKTMPALLWQHDPTEPIGRWLDAREDARGLAVKGKLTLGTARGAEARALMLDGALGLSIGFRIRDAAAATAGTDARRMLKRVELVEISLVSMPAQPEARITDAKAATPAASITDARSFERFLRDAGFSRTFAKAATARGFKAAAGLRDAGGDAAELVRAIRAQTESLNRITKGLPHGR